MNTMNPMNIQPVLVIDIDDTLFVHKSPLLEYHKIRPDYHLKAQLQRIQLPKFILTNATFSHANVILNKMNVDEEFKKIYSRDNIPRMKPSLECYARVQTDISTELQHKNNVYLFFDDLLDNLKNAHIMGWKTIWISPNYKDKQNYPFLDFAFPSLKEALDKISFM